MTINNMSFTRFIHNFKSVGTHSKLFNVNTLIFSGPAAYLFKITYLHLQFPTILKLLQHYTSLFATAFYRNN